jgi:hypothetical protein
MTARDLITRALRTIGVLAQGETPTAAEAQDALLALQDMVGSWGLHPLTLLTRERPTFNLVANEGTYTLGTWVATATSPQPTVAVVGAAGATTYSYRVVATLTTGEVLAAGATGSTATGNATLTGVNLNRLTWPAVTGAATYDVYRTVGGATQGAIATGLTVLTLDDTGLAGDGAAVPTVAVGPPTHWERVRPTWVEAISLYDPTEGLESPLVPVTDEQWHGVTLKATTSDPQWYWVNAGWPYTEVSFYPVPATSDDDVILHLPVATVAFADLTTDYTFAPGYADAFRYQLAVRLAPEYGRPLDPQVAALAADALATIKRVNARPIEMTIDPALVVEGAWNILTG